MNVRSEPGGDPARFEPPVSRVAAPFWDATRARRLVLQHCQACAKAIWYPRVLCPGCGGDELEWQEVSGDGVVYAVSVQYRAAHPALTDRVPYAVVLVDLDAGVRLMSNVIGCAPERVTVGQRVRPAWEALSDGRHLLMFEPTDELDEPDTTTAS